MNPCFYENQNSHQLNSGENYYFFQLNEMCEFQEFNEKPSTLDERLAEKTDKTD